MDLKNSNILNLFFFYLKNDNDNYNSNRTLF